MSAPVQFWCSACKAPLHLENTLWKSPDGDYRCNTSGGDVIAEQYTAALPNRTFYRERIMHQPSSSWVHPALRAEREEGAA